MHKVVDHEYLADAVAQLIELALYLVNIHARIDILDRLEHDNTLGERGAERIDGTQIPLGVLCLELFDGHFRRSERAADARGHTDIQNVVTGLQGGLHVLLKSKGVNLRGVDACVLSYRTVVAGTVKFAGVGAHALLAVEDIRQRDDGDAEHLGRICGQVCGCIGKNAVTHSNSLCNLICQIRLSRY